MDDQTIAANIAVIGATGLVGGAVLEQLAAEGVDAGQVKAVATDNSVGERVDFGDTGIWVDPIDKLDFEKVDLAIFAAPADVSLEYAEKALDAGCRVIDSSTAYANSGYPVFAADLGDDLLPESPLYVSPHPLAFAVAEIASSFSKVAYIQRAQLNGLMPISSRGKEGMKVLAGETVSLLSGKPPEGGVLGTQVAFNVVPFGAETGEDFALDEVVVQLQTRKLLGDDLLPVGVSLVYVPVFFGASCFLELEMAESVSKEQAVEVLQDNAWVVVTEGDSKPTPVTDAGMSDQIVVGKIVSDSESSYRISMWLVVDNVKVAAARNIVTLSKLLLKRFQ